MNKEKIGKFIARIRKQKGITTYDLQRVGVHPNQIKSIEQGGNYEVNTLIKVVDCLELTISITQP